ncbi:GNAT family N-acetyltransferase [Kribbella antibiotica]|uniref:GNAT family N-acetyltransferase n=1 Tax=Kribbella antibiotica TaxID=190195 RepID=A0A4R4ZMB3_9ACTN|nr:GNAT family N-acetyltransferase [Kribbella antibiotica]TDD59981.1 GNAT family N-acetyltransferase [Kribbella antibiotica]
MPEATVRPITADDWERIAELEKAAYEPLGLAEGRSALEAWGALSPQTCFVVGLPVQAYVLAMPFPYGEYPALGQPSAASSDNLHLHDLCVAPESRRTGLGQQLVGHLTAVATGYRRISLIALSGTSSFWSAQGFGPAPAVPVGYGDDARYLTKVL